ncbi:M16 family metallopeptidase [Wolbachia endosymbiont of Pentidionis agamae]|uniref:M16 family metallopeptidase n=1 Tax=Wolbachia endosymbiont of Pentidionis agamae TaxID=3110435 RepID=UPI002FD54F9B
MEKCIPQLTQLSNGLRIITEHINDVNSIALSIRVDTGSRSESNDKNGISHFLEHMAFKGTKTRTAFDIAKAFDDIGGIFNASTGRESTTYYAKILNKDLEIGLEILVDILINSVFPEDELKREKGVVLQEIFQTNDLPNDIIFDKYMEVAYRNQSFGRSILGTKETVQSFTRADLNNYIDEYYSGTNILLAIAGDIVHERVVLFVEKVLSKICTKSRRKFHDAHYTGGEYLEYRKLDQVNLLIGFPGVSYYDNKYCTLQVFNSLFGEGMSSRLFQEIREKQGLAYSIYSFNSSYTDTGILSIFAGTDSSNLRKLITSITEELKNVLLNLTEEEVTRVKCRITSQILMSRESMSARAEILNHHYSIYNRYISKEELIERINDVSITNIKEVVASLLSRCGQITLAAIGEIGLLPSYDEIVSSLKI